jgi:hypothetical protein
MEAEQALAARGLLLLPDFIANAGGVICAAIEYRGGTEGAALALIAEEFRANTAEPCSTRCGALAHCHARRQYPSPPSGRAGRCEYGNGMQWRDELH